MASSQSMPVGVIAHEKVAGELEASSVPDAVTDELPYVSTPLVRLIGHGEPIIECVLPAPVWPYANTVTLYPFMAFRISACAVRA